MRIPHFFDYVCILIEIVLPSNISGHWRGNIYFTSFGWILYNALALKWFDKKSLGLGVAVKALHVLLVLFCLLSSSVMAAATPEQLAAAEKLLKVMGSDLVYEQYLDQMDSDLEATFQRELSGLQPSDNENAIAKQSKAETANVIREALAWKKVRTQIMYAYAEEFQLNELQRLTAFYQSPLGKKALNKLPSLNRTAMRQMQLALLKVTPKLEEIKKDMVKDLKASLKARGEVGFN